MSRAAIHHLIRFAFIAAAAVAYVLALLPSDPAIFANDKANHGLAFAVLALLARLGWSQNSALTIAIGLVIFGIMIEASQAVPFIGRDASLADVYADAIATIVGLAAGTLLLRLIRRLRPDH